jgi:hypothetical protein
MRQESQRTGQVLSNEVLKSLDDTQDSFDKAAHSIKAGFMKAVAESKPLLVGFSEMLQKVGIDLDAVAQKATDWRLGERLRVILGLGMIKPIPEPEVFGPPSPPGEVFGPPLPPKGAPQLTIAQRIQMAQAAAAAAQNRLAIAGAASLAGPGSEVDLLQRQITLSQQKVRVDLDGLAAQRALELTDKGRLELAQKQEKVVTDFIIEQIRLTKELTDLERQHQQQIDAGTVSAVEAQLAEEEATDAAIRALQELDRLADQDAQAKIRAGWVEAAEAVIEYEDAVRRAYEQQDRLRFDERMKEIQAGTGPIFESLNRALSGTVTGILQGTQTLQQAFANMGRNIAASLIENVIQKGLAVLQKALDDFLESLIRSGLIQQTARAGVGLLTSLLGAGASPGTLDAGGALAAAGGLGAYPYASGGLVTRPTLGLIGEGGPEVVIPLKDGAVPVSGGWGGGRTEIHIHNNTNATVEHTESRGPDGRVIHDVVIGEVRRAIQSGEMDKILSPYALSRQPVRR